MPAVARPDIGDGHYEIDGHKVEVFRGAQTGLLVVKVDNGRVGAGRASSLEAALVSGQKWIDQHHLDSAPPAE